MKEFEFKELKKATQNFCPSKIIGKGSHGCVYKGVLENGQIVAIKKSSIALQILQDNSKLDNEITILSSLPKMSNSVSLLGTSHLDSLTNSAVMVMEFMPNGSLHDSLHATDNNSVLTIMSWSRRVKIAIQLAKSLQFLHNLKPKVVHRDVKSANVLFDRDWNVKLGDFGLALRLNINDRVDSVSRPAGTIGYLDPCYTTPCMLSTKNDVFSFGVVLLELISGERVIDSSRSHTCIVDWALPLIKSRKFELIFDQRVTMPAFMGRMVRKLLGIACRCVRENHNRPTMDEIVYEIENCYVERVRFRIWVKFIIREIIIVKRERKLANGKIRGREIVLEHSTGSNTSLRK